MPTRYGRPDATKRTSPQRQPPVNRSMAGLLELLRLVAADFHLESAGRLAEEDHGILVLLQLAAERNAVRLHLRVERPRPLRIELAHAEVKPVGQGGLIVCF